MIKFKGRVSTRSRRVNNAALESADWPPIVRTVRHALAIGSASILCAAAAQAQTAPAAPAAETGTEQLQEIVVTGSLIKRVNIETAEAITILKTDNLKQLGIQNVEQVLNQITASNPSVNLASATGSFSGGGTYADLRGLGRGRTLILLDGERIAPNAFDGNGVDLSGIPFGAIDTIDVLREGASSLYGTDAIAGVINFKTKKNYQGAEFNATYDRPQEDHGSSYQADFTFGHGDIGSDGYNILFTASYHRQQEIQASQRGFSAAGFNPEAGVFNTNYYGSFPGVVIDSHGNFWQYGYPACKGNPYLTTYFGDCSYRYSAATDDIPDSHEISSMIAVTKTLPANNEIKVQYFWTQSYQNNYSGPVFYQFTMSPTSPYFPSASQLSCQRGAANCSTATPDLTDPIQVAWTPPDNSRYGGNLNVQQRILITFSGNNGGWDYQANGNWSKNTNDDRWTGGIPNEFTPSTQYTPIAPGGVLSNLINPFGPQTAAGEALYNSSYVNGPYQIGEYTRWDVDGSIQHPLGDVFDAGSPATFGLGAMVEGERYSNATTPANDLTKAATGLTDSAVEGTRQVQAAYVELAVPVTKGFDFDVSDRQDRYSDFGTTNNAKLQVRYQPTSFMTLRGAASTGFRAPTLYNLYSPPFLAASSSGTMGQGNPFCAPGHYTAEWTPTTCSAQGIGLNGGNRNLTPETSQNFDFGVVLSPVEDLGITLDYWRILLKNRIATVPASAIYGNPTLFSNYIVPATSGQYAGTLPPTIAEATVCNPYTAPTCGYINEAFTNTGRITTDGFDLSVQYAQHTSIGTFHEDLEGTAVIQFREQQYTGGPETNEVGWLQIINFNPAFRWTHKLSVDWTSPNKMWGAGLNERYYAGYIDEYPDLAGNQRYVGSYSLVDGYASVQPMEGLTVLFGVKNILNTWPPFTNASSSNFTGGYNPLIADPLLRNFYINIKYKFL